MKPRSKNLSISSAIYFVSMFFLSAYFTFAAVQGDFGLFRRVQIDAKQQDLTAQLATLNAKVAAMVNKTHRLSDGYLDLDLLDQQTRKVLGYMRSDEIVIR